MPLGELQDLPDRCAFKLLPGIPKPLGDESRKRLFGDRVELDLLGAPPERLVLIVEDPLHEMALASEVDVGDLRLLLKHRSHEIGKLGVEIHDLLELINDQSGPVAPFGRELSRQLEETLEGR